MTPGPTPATLPLSRSMQGAGMCTDTPQLPYLMMPRSSMSITNTKGLLNMPGQNNCFLNSAVQVLWHLDIFRRSFRELSGHACMAESCIFCALKELFAQFQYSQESALPPDALRRALAETFCDQRRFQLGFMDDAAECFENILMRIHFHIANQESEDMCSVSHCIPHQKFAMTLVEQTVCHSCGATSEPLPFTQMVHYVPSSALCSQAKSMRGKGNEVLGFGELLRRAGGLGDLRDCPSSCGAVIQIRKTLMNRPEIVSVGLVWDSERPTIEHIMDVFSTIGLTLKLQDVFHSVVDNRWAASATHQLVGIVTYYGKHYSTFFFHTKLRVWIYFDDAAVREIGPNWEQVVEKCCRGHFQPLLLLYANPYGTSVSTSTAPRAVTTVHGHKKSSSGKNIFGISLSSEKQGRNHLPVNCQRRALTPNPEVSYDFSANVQPRRAVTPSAEISMIEDIKDSKTNLKCETNCDSTAQCVPFSTSNANSNNQTFTQSWDAHVSHNLHEHRSSKHVELKNCKSISSVPENQNVAFPIARTLSLNPDICKVPRPNDSNHTDSRHFMSNKNSLTSRPASVDDLLNTSALSGLMGSEYTSYLVNGMSEDNINSFDGKNISCQDEHGIENAYISRKTVENVLHLQKLQRQKSVNAKHGHAGVNQRNSSSSLESLDNVFLLKDKGISNFLGLKLDLPDLHNIARRRDSGNWSGDRNSASSSSTTSLDNPYCYLVGNKRPFCNSNNIRNAGRTCALDPTSFTDPGYDSFSLSSSDSYPSTITNSPGKLDPRLVQIPENMQTAFLQSDFSRLQFLSKDPINGNITCGLKDDCGKLCIEADIFLAKSVERENVGDISMAALLSDTAAAKARAAMDAPYSNTQSLALAKLKHSMCVIRSSSLHKKLKEAEAVQRRKQKESVLNTHHSHQTHNNNMPTSEFSSKDNSEKNSISSPSEPNKNQSNVATENDEYDGGKSIEIYATLPKKTLKKKGALMSFVESLTGEDSSSEKGNKQKLNHSSSETVVENGVSVHNENGCSNASQSPIHKNAGKSDVTSKSPNIKKKQRSQQKICNRDSDLSDYSSEWEHSKKSSLYRTYSGPPSDSKLEFGDLSKENLHQTFSGHPTKKQHKIRRKLMGGFMKRKNRSLPDLREGQDQTTTVSRSFDDCVIAQTPASLRKQEVRDMKDSSLIFRNPQNGTISPSINGKFQTKATVHFGKNSEIKRPITHTQSFGPLPKTSPVKQVARTQTPPPYRPPPPLVDAGNHRSLSPKRNSSQNEEVNKVFISQAHHTSSKESIGSPTEKQKKQLSFIGRKIVPQPSVVENNCPPNSPSKSGIQYLKYSYDNEIPKGSAVWLKELQLKQEELIQKRKLLEDKETFQKEYPYMPQHKLACVIPRNIEANNSNIHNLPQTKGANDPKQSNSNTKTEEEELDSHRTVDQNTSQSSPHDGPESQKSVKDLASKFEKILKPCLQLADSLQGNSDSTLSQNLTEKCVSTSASSTHSDVTLSCSVPSVETKVTEMCGAKENKENTSLDSSKQHYPMSFTPGFIYNPHLTEGQLTNMLRIGTNRAAFRNPNVVANSKDSYSAFTPYTTSHGFDFNSRSELRRPDKPPDYETAVQRLELIRGDKNILYYFGSNGLVNPECSFSLLEQAKKKRGPKKSVTFSDKVVLVACAGDEDNDFIPNPLLERVYKQHLMQKSTSTSPPESKGSEAQHLPPAPKDCSKPLTQSCCAATASKVFNTSTSQTPCHLCHKKTVTPPTVYCPDCAFYMSRFQQK